MAGRGAADPLLPTREHLALLLQEPLLCVADRDGHTWLRGESVLYAPAQWQEDFEVFVVDVDLSTWEWTAARQLQQSVAVSP